MNIHEHEKPILTEKQQKLYENFTNSIINGCEEEKQENCNHCIYRQDVSSHFDLEDYCSLNMKRTGRIIMDKDCPLGEVEDIGCLQ